MVKHIGCSMLCNCWEDLGTEAAKELEGLDFLPFPDLEQAVKGDAEYLKGSKAIPSNVTINGWVYEVETGKVRQVA